MKFKKLVAAILMISLIAMTACSNSAPVTTEPETTGSQSTAQQPAEKSILPEKLTEYQSMTPEEICATLTLEQKAAQMMEPTIYHVEPEVMAEVDYGSILSKYEAWPMPKAEKWMETVRKYQKNALDSEACLPFFYGNDSLHGVNFASGCVIFPHNINVGAADDPDLTEEYGKLVGSDIAHTGMLLNFSPCVAAAQDPRWGRTYESFSSDNERVKKLALAYTKGLLSEGVIVCPKHFFGEGYTKFGSGEDPDTMLLDRGDAVMSPEQIDDQLGVYRALIDEGAQVIMISHSALNGVKMHENAEYIGILKNEMGFDGMVLSDWDSILNCSGETYKDNVILAVNAGIDMFMSDYNHDECMKYIIEGVTEGLITQDRVDDAVTRIIRVKKEAGLFEDPFLEDMTPSYEFNSDRSHEVARQLAAKSFVKLKNSDKDLTLKAGMRVFVTGPAADDAGALCGGWTYFWQGGSDADFGGKFTGGDSILEALQAQAQEIGFEVVTDKKKIDTCDVVVLCVGEKPYSEWYGDAEDISLTGPCGLLDNRKAIDLAKESGLPTVTLIVAGRNVTIGEYLDRWDSVTMLYLPGTEGGYAAADVLTGRAEAEGKLPMPYYSSTDQIGTGECWHDIGWSAE